MANKKTTHRKQAAGSSDEFDRARMKIRQNSNVRKGLASFRHKADCQTLLMVGSDFASHPSYRSLIWPSPFPQRIGSLPIRGLPYYAGFSRELAWAVSTISVYSVELNAFLDLKRKCEQLFFISDLQGVEKILDSVQETFGISIWLIDQRLTHLLLSKGYSAKNNFVKNIMKDVKSPSLMRLATSWLSYRLLAGVSATELERLLTELNPLKDGYDYLLHIIMGQQVAIDEATAGIMIWEADNLPVIDRYLLLVLTLQSLVSTAPLSLSDSTQFLAATGKIAKTIDDKSLSRINIILGDKLSYVDLDPQIIELLDRYTNAEYNEVLQKVSCMELDELSIEKIYIAIRSALHIDSTFTINSKTTGGKSLVSSICADLNSIANFNEGGVEANLRLRKLVTTYASSAWASSLAAVLERQGNDDRAFASSRSQTFHALRTAEEHPLSAFSYTTSSTTNRILQNQLAQHPNSSTIIALNAISLPSWTIPITDGDLIPSSRTKYFNALSWIRNNKELEAIDILDRLSTERSPRLKKLEALLLLVQCHLRQGQIAECADVAGELLAISKYFAVVLPLTEIVKQILLTHNLPMSKSPTRGRLSVAIILDAYSWYISPEYDAERADAFRDVLKRSNVKKASELLKNPNTLSRIQLVYFLRQICVPDVLDQSLALESTRAVEDERATILVELNDLIASEGKQPPSQFKDELREIRTRQVVRDTARRLDRSKVYVNVDGIRRAIDVRMRENWNRYRLMAQYGAGDSNLGSIERIVRSALGELGDQVTVITLNTPLNERRSLFRKMVVELWELLTTSKEYGLNSNLSTNIRHGYVLRELRGPLVGRNLITNKDSESGSYQNNIFWADRIQTDVQNIKSDLSASLSAFSEKIDQQIDKLNRSLLRIRSEKTPNGLFNYSLSESVLQNMEYRNAQTEMYEDFISSVLDQFWKVTEHNLNRVRENLFTSVLQEFNESLNKLEEDLRENSTALYVPGVMTAINMVRPEVRSAIDRVASWFTLSGNNEYQDYDLEIAYQAGLQTVKTYYANVSISAKFESNVVVILKGSSLPTFARLFFLLLDNAAFHGAHNRSELNLIVSVEFSEKSFLLEVRNDLPPAVDLPKLDLKIKSINEDYGHEKAAELLGEEGGSGYPKIWKLLNFDLRCDHGLAVLRDDGDFVAQLLIDPRGLH
ncbi:hypothetical protein [Methylobacterium sp. J-092]|uniref:hypothetical protein n=1 Tax=Methylobacterium sp. J-092 TaxID=2836667 RepID=UPI001FBAF419|nr:hypothetical protein [Methylobacterium sp. J-092]MCJ2007968.1 hypothetical protein [Methylobacterium sp. J-092]